ncbi:hypothetical protein [Longispora urticae]
MSAQSLATTPVDPPPTGGRTPTLLRLLPAAVGAVGLLALLLVLGTSVVDIAKYTGYLVYGVMLPGVLVYRSLRRAPHSLLDDLVMGGVVGLALEIGGYVAAGSLGLLAWLPAWPLVVVAVFLAVPALRRHWRPVTYPHRTPIAWSWSVLVVVGCFLLYMLDVQLRGQGPTPAPGGSRYLYDLEYLLSLAAEAKHHFPLTVPQVTNEPLHYHWFASAHHAAGSIISGTDLATVYFRFDPILVSVGAVLVLALAGWRITGRPWVGALAAALTFAVGELSLETFSIYFGSSTTFVWTSPTAAYSWLFTFALLIVAVEVIRPSGLPGAPLGRGVWPLAIGLGLALTGAKSSGVPTILAGVVLVLGVGVLRRQRQPRVWLLLACLVGVYLFAMAVLYRFQSLGVSLDPLSNVGLSLTTVDHGSWARKVALYVIAVLGYAAYQLPRLAGVVVLAYLAVRKRAPWTGVEWFLLGAIAAGVGGTTLLGHPGSSQLYFLRSIWGAGAILSAIGFVRLAERHSVRGRTMAAVLIGAAVAMTGVLGVLRHSGRFVQGLGVWIWKPVVAAVVATVVVAVVAGLFLGLLRRTGRIPAGVAALAALSVVLMAGAPALYIDTRSLGGRWGGYHELVTRDMVDAAHWVRDRSDPDDVLVTNQHRTVGVDSTQLSFWLNAYTERHTLVGSWSYVPRLANTARDLKINAALLPFWDQELLARNDAAITGPTAGGLRELRDDYGVRWIVVNRQVGVESPDLARLADLRLVRGHIAVYSLR